MLKRVVRWADNVAQGKDDRRQTHIPLVTVKDPATITDLHATIFTAMGISPKTIF